MTHPQSGGGGPLRLLERLAPPHSLMDTAHWAFVAFGAALVFGYLIQLALDPREGIRPWLRWLTAAALVATGWVWHRGYRRRRYGGWDCVVDAVCLFLVALTVESVAAGAELMYVRTSLRSMSGSLRGKLLHSAAGLGAMASGLLLSDVRTERVLFRLLIAGGLLFLLTVLLHAFAGNLARYDRALDRERALASISSQLTGRVDVQRICEGVIAGVTKLSSRWVQAFVAIGPRDRLQVLATTEHLSQAIGTLLALDDEGRLQLAQPSQPQARFVAWTVLPTRPSLQVIAITAREELYGVLMVDSPRPIGPNLHAALESLCSSAGLALANAMLTEELTKLAFHDPLTRLANRSLLSEQTDKSLARAKRSGTTNALFVLDLDGFKRINDEFGHLAGDEALVIVAARLLDQVREGDVVARLGGDEFAVLLTDLHDPAEATTVARRIIRALSGPVLVSDHELPVGVSIGIAIWPCPVAAPGAKGSRQAPQPKLDDLLHNADTVMYVAKSRGSGYEVFGHLRHAEPDSAAEPRRRTTPERDA